MGIVAEPAAPSTAAVRFLRAHDVPYTEHFYRYEDRGGTTAAARALGVPEHQVIKTLVMQDERAVPLIVLMHGDLEVSTKQLARKAGCKSIEPCRPDVATRHTGYLVGGTSPFGTRTAMPTYLERSILDLPVAYVNGGARGFLLGLAPAAIVRVLEPRVLTVGIRPSGPV
jgi:Cys-tRNA(Pro) deacylase